MTDNKQLAKQLDTYSLLLTVESDTASTPKQRARYLTAAKLMGEAASAIAKLSRNLAMHNTPTLAVWENHKASQEAIDLITKAGIDVNVVKVGCDYWNLIPPYLFCDCPGGSGIERIRELVKRAVAFVYTGKV